MAGGYERDFDPLRGGKLYKDAKVEVVWGTLYDEAP